MYPVLVRALSLVCLVRLVRRHFERILRHELLT
jgi:hypothetical protein